MVAQPCESIRNHLAVYFKWANWAHYSDGTYGTEAALSSSSGHSLHPHKLARRSQRDTQDSSWSFTAWFWKWHSVPPIVLELGAPTRGGVDRVAYGCQELGVSERHAKGWSADHKSGISEITGYEMYCSFMY